MRAFRLVVVLVMVALMAGGCRYRPGGTAFIFRINSEREFTSWRVEYPDVRAGQKPVKLKWYDENTYLTHDSLAPGPYILSVRHGTGGFFRLPFEVTTDKWYYEFEEPVTDDSSMPEVVTGPRISGTIDSAGREMPVQVVVVLFGEDVVTRRSGVRNGQFEVQMPAAGSARIEVVAPGKPPRSWRGEYLEITGDLDLGTIRLN